MIPIQSDIVTEASERLVSQFNTHVVTGSYSLYTSLYPALISENLDGMSMLTSGAALKSSLKITGDWVDSSSYLTSGASLRNINRDYDSGFESVSGNGCEITGVTLVQTLFPVVYVDYDSGFESVSGNGCEMLGVTLVQTLFPVDYDSGFEATSGNGCEILSITLT